MFYVEPLSTNGLNRREFLRLGGAGMMSALLLSTMNGPALAKSHRPVRQEITSAGKKHKVPDELLLAMGYVNTLWEMPPPEANDYEEGDIEGRGTYGIMQLEQNSFRDTLSKAADLTGLPEKKLKNDLAANIQGGAALLSELAGSKKPVNLDGWYEVVAEYQDTDLYAQAVFEALKSGASETTSSGEKISLASQNVDTPQTYTAQGHEPGHNTDYSRALWRSAARGNFGFSNREQSYNIDKVIIHVAQGSYAGTVRYFNNPGAGVSSHYVVSRTGTIAQCVRHKNIAYHAGYYPYNTRSIGIEHEGFVSSPRYFTSAMYQSSARLTAYCCKRHGIPVDRAHIIGHYQVPGCPGYGGGASCHTDPGRYWDWDRYIALVRYHRRRI